MLFLSQMRLALILACFSFSSALAGPYIPAGDMLLRHDIQQLADAGVIKGPTTTWPLAWGPILNDIRDVSALNLKPEVADALARVRSRANWGTRSEELRLNAKASFADKPTRIRSFQDTPRGKVEAGGGIGWIGDWFSLELNVQGVDSDSDDDEVRADGSLVGVVVGNWSVAASTQQRWWGPGWDGSLILSNNARPIPSLVVDRVFTNAFETKWLSWLGPWDFSLMFGRLEKERAVPNAQFFSLRVNFMPLQSLEIGLSRSAQWCGDGRPCSASTFADLFLGRDNIGDAGVGSNNEPGNQLAGVDFRWSPSFIKLPVSAYGQFVGEDEAGGLPSRWIGLIGGDWSSYFLGRWSTRIYAEFAGTSCQFYESSELFNCAYNHGTYSTGYRYRSRAIGHAADNDSRLVSVGAMMVNAADTRWHLLLRSGALNRGGPPDLRNSVSTIRQDIASIDVSYSRTFSFGLIDVGAGYEKVDDDSLGTSSSDGRFYLQWRSSY